MHSVIKCPPGRQRVCVCMCVCVSGQGYKELCNSSCFHVKVRFMVKYNVSLQEIGCSLAFWKIKAHRDSTLSTMCNICHHRGSHIRFILVFDLWRNAALRRRHNINRSGTGTSTVMPRPVYPAQLSDTLSVMVVLHQRNVKIASYK